MRSKNFWPLVGLAVLLVPAWLFTVNDSPEPVAQVAVNPSYLASPAHAPSIGPPASSGVSAVPAPPQPR